MRKRIKFIMLLLAASMTVTPTAASVMTETVHAAKAKYSAKYFKRMGVIRWGGWKWTWYSQKVLPGGGLRIPGRHVDKSGYVCDKKDRIVLSSSTVKRGKVVKTPFGKKGKVYDTGCARGVYDVFTNF
jgi:hypothetical protein